MSQCSIGKPSVRTSTNTSRIPGTNATRTTTTTQIREINACAGKSGIGGGPAQAVCGKCPSNATSKLRPPGFSGQGSLQAPQSRIPPPQSRIPPPQSRLQPPQSRLQPPQSRLQPPQSRLQPPQTCMPSPPARMAPPPSRAFSPQADICGQYNMPAEYGPQTVKGKGMVYSSPPGLRGQIEGKMPKDLKYFSSKPPPGGRDRAALQRVPHLEDTFSGNFQVGGGSRMCESMNMSSERSQMDQNADAQQLFDLSTTYLSPVAQRVEERVEGVLRRSPESKVFGRDAQMMQIQQQNFTTPAGEEPVVQQAYIERTVRRDEDSERIIKNISVTDLDERTGLATQIVFSEQQVDSKYAMPMGQGHEVVSIKESIAVTPSYKTTAKEVTVEQSKPKLSVSPAELLRLVQEEREDVENTLKMAPPEMALQPEKYAIKKRLQKLRLHSESMVLLEEAVVNSTVTADEVQVETAPETIAGIMHSVEHGMSPSTAPDQIFNSLFTEKPNELSVAVSSVGPGPLQDVVVPVEINQVVLQEALNAEMTQLSDKFLNIPESKDVPYVDIFTKVMSDDQKKPTKGKKERSFKITDETLPWGEEDIEPVVNIVGAEPVEVLQPTDVTEMEQEDLEKNLCPGIEYFVDADPVQYASKVQLRGSQAPSYFPGYLMAFPEFPELVKIARNPDEVLYSAWKATKPRIFPDDSVSVLF